MKDLGYFLLILPLSLIGSMLIGKRCGAIMDNVHHRYPMKSGTRMLIFTIIGLVCVISSMSWTTGLRNIWDWMFA